MTAWIFAVGAAVMMVGLWLTAVFYACFVWKWMSFRNAVLPIMAGEYLFNDRKAFELEIHQAETLLGWMWLAFVVNAVANVFSQIPKRMSGRNQVFGGLADRLSTCICLIWFVLVVGGFVV